MKTQNKKTEAAIAKFTVAFRKAAADLAAVLHPLTPEARFDTPKARAVVLREAPKIRQAVEKCGVHTGVDLDAMVDNAARAALFAPVIAMLQETIDDLEDSTLQAGGAAWPDVLVCYKALSGIIEIDASIARLLEATVEEFRVNKPGKPRASQPPLTKPVAANDDGVTPKTPKAEDDAA